MTADRKERVPKKPDDHPPAECEIYDSGVAIMPKACRTHGCYMSPWGCPREGEPRKES